VALIEVVIASSLVLMVSIAITQLLAVTTRMAAANRVLTAARVVVQRNLDKALTIRWDSSTSPSVFAITPAAGIVYDDDDSTNGEGANKIALLVEKQGDTPYTLIPATMTRTVTAVTNTQGADIRRIKFSLVYTFQNRPQLVEMTTLRSIDD
jgi:hypothetical protein